MNIIKPSIPMKSLPQDTSMLETECLFGEKVDIIDKKLNWILCELKTDKYIGWVKNSGLGILKFPTHRVIVERTFIFVEKNIKSNYLHYLPLGSKISVNNIEDDWASIYLSDKHQFPLGYVPKKHIISVNSKTNDWVATAEQLVHTPYIWGGRDTLGIDCSALLQLSYQTYGKNIPRNTGDQIKLKNKIITNMNDLVRGSVVFWKGHVGIMTDSINLIHANAYHMKTVIEPLTEVIYRMDKAKIIKIMNFN